jgi:uncharacterized membrane protein YphA (DoxX/SURF4 family)
MEDSFPAVREQAMPRILQQLRARRWAHLMIVNLRILLGFAFLPAGIKKILHQPFTDPANSGPFHDFLHAFYATGFFYQFVGGVQLAAAALLLTQTQPLLAALTALPVFTVITVFCWSTGVWFTAVFVTLMLCGCLLLVLWDYPRWKPLLGSDPAALPIHESEAALLDTRAWRLCGSAILFFYTGTCIYQGGVYRPMGVELDNPAFWVLPALILFPGITWLIEQRNRKE